MADTYVPDPRWDTHFPIVICPNGSAPDPACLLEKRKKFDWMMDHVMEWEQRMKAAIWSTYYSIRSDGFGSDADKKKARDDRDHDLAEVETRATWWRIKHEGEIKAEILADCCES